MTGRTSDADTPGLASSPSADLGAAMLAVQASELEPQPQPVQASEPEGGEPDDELPAE